MKLFLIFFLVPILEIVIFIKITQIIGLGWTLFTILATAAAGSFAVKKQGLNILFRLKKADSNPIILISNGLLILIAGLFLITPGLITDAAGFSLLIPHFRQLVVRYLQNRFNPSNLTINTPNYRNEKTFNFHENED